VLARNTGWCIVSRMKPLISSRLDTTTEAESPWCGPPRVHRTCERIQVGKGLPIPRSGGTRRATNHKFTCEARPKKHLGSKLPRYASTLSEARRGITAQQRRSPALSIEAFEGMPRRTSTYGIRIAAWKEGTCEKADWPRARANGWLFA
jgi:hypothetical protein